MALQRSRPLSPRYPPLGGGGGEPWGLGRTAGVRARGGGAHPILRAAHMKVWVEALLLLHRVMLRQTPYAALYPKP